MTSVDHQNVLQIIKHGEAEYVSQDQTKKYTVLYIVLELA